MNKLIYPNSISFNGPFLIDEEILFEIDKIIDEGWQNYIDIQNDRFKNELEEKTKSSEYHTKEEIEHDLINSYQYEKKRELEIIFKSGNILRCESFHEAAKEPSAKNEIPISFSYIIKTYDNNTNVSISKYSTSSLEISTSPNNSTNNDILFKLTRWGESIQSKKWVQIWKNNVLIIWPIFFVLLSISSIFITSQSDVSKRILTKQAITILKDGIDSSEIKKSIELLLYNNYGIIPYENPEARPNNQAWYFTTLILLLLTIVLSFTPSTYLGIGKGGKKIRFWKTWLKIISFYIPISIVLPIIINKISNIF
jgi:hypothetical protein